MTDSRTLLENLKLNYRSIELGYHPRVDGGLGILGIKVSLEKNPSAGEHIERPPIALDLEPDEFTEVSSDNAENPPHSEACFGVPGERARDYFERTSGRQGERNGCTLYRTDQLIMPQIETTHSPPSKIPPLSFPEDNNAHSEESIPINPQLAEAEEKKPEIKSLDLLTGSFSVPASAQGLIKTLEHGIQKHDPVNAKKKARDFYSANKELIDLHSKIRGGDIVSFDINTGEFSIKRGQGYYLEPIKDPTLNSDAVNQSSTQVHEEEILAPVSEASQGEDYIGTVLLRFSEQEFDPTPTTIIPAFIYQDGGIKTFKNIEGFQNLSDLEINPSMSLLEIKNKTELNLVGTGNGTQHHIDWPEDLDKPRYLKELEEEIKDRLDNPHRSIKELADVLAESPLDGSLKDCKAEDRVIERYAPALVCEARTERDFGTVNGSSESKIHDPTEPTQNEVKVSPEENSKRNNTFSVKLKDRGNVLPDNPEDRTIQTSINNNYDGSLIKLLAALLEENKISDPMAAANRLYANNKEALLALEQAVSAAKEVSIKLEADSEISYTLL